MQTSIQSKQKIFVGVSGGVDSSVAAYLLKEQGYDVHGIFVKTWSPEWVPCTWVEEKRDAMRVCAALDIPFHFLDAAEAYKNGVAEYMIGEYRSGRTPNPDVLCNRVIKFGVMWEYAKKQGADAIATGHYAQTDGVQLIKGVDPAKDQSYFLWMLHQQELSHIRFPIGHLPKKEVRALAERAQLFTASKKDSQGICFLGDVDMKDFLQHYIEQKTGDVYNDTGVLVGHHEGVWFYTIGERHGFTITETSPDRTPYYVTGKDIDQNILYVSHAPERGSLRAFQIVTLADANWIKEPKRGESYEAQIRYHGALHPVEILDHTTVKVESSEILPLGQSLVIYHHNTLLCGGKIDRVL